MLMATRNRIVPPPALPVIRRQVCESASLKGREPGAGIHHLRTPPNCQSLPALNRKLINTDDNNS